MGLSYQARKLDSLIGAVLDGLLAEYYRYKKSDKRVKKLMNNGALFGEKPKKLVKALVTRYVHSLPLRPSHSFRVGMRARGAAQCANLPFAGG